MITPEVITNTVFEWVQSLDYEYMLIHTIVSYGLYFSPNMEWISKKLGGIPYSIWKVGAYLAIIEVIRIIPFIYDNNGDYFAAVTQKIVSILHSYLLIQVFVEDIVNSVNNWVGLIRRAKNS